MSTLPRTLSTAMYGVGGQCALYYVRGMGDIENSAMYVGIEHSAVLGGIGHSTMLRLNGPLCHVWGGGH